MKSTREWTLDEVRDQLRSLGVQEGGVLVVHSSFRSVRPIQGGPTGLIEALRAALGTTGTLVMPSWTGDDDEPFDRCSTPASADLGVVVQTFWRMPGVVRSDHLQAFAAVGPLAERMTKGPLPLPPHVHESPVGYVFDADGQVLLLGVGHDANTTLHLAEALGRVPYGQPKHCTVLEGDRKVRLEYVETDHCGQRFALADDWLRERGQQAEGPVGNAHARLFRSRHVVAAAQDAIARDPFVFLHAEGSGCEECDQARRTPVSW